MKSTNLIDIQPVIPNQEATAQVDQRPRGLLLGKSVISSQAQPNPTDNIRYIRVIPCGKPSKNQAAPSLKGRISSVPSSTQTPIKVANNPKTLPLLEQTAQLNHLFSNFYFDKINEILTGLEQKNTYPEIAIEKYRKLVCFFESLPILLQENNINKAKQKFIENKDFFSTEQEIDLISKFLNRPKIFKILEKEKINSFIEFTKNELEKSEAQQENDSSRSDFPITPAPELIAPTHSPIKLHEEGAMPVGDSPMAANLILSIRQRKAFQTPQNNPTSSQLQEGDNPSTEGSTKELLKGFRSSYSQARAGEPNKAKRKLELESEQIQKKNKTIKQQYKKTTKQKNNERQLKISKLKEMFNKNISAGRWKLFLNITRSFISQKHLHNFIEKYISKLSKEEKLLFNKKFTSKNTMYREKMMKMWTFKK